MKQMKVCVQKGVTAADILDSIEATVIRYMSTARQLDEVGMRKLIDQQEPVRASYFRKIERMVQCLIRDGAPAAFFGRKA